jgi:SAM-dependent methyltransferase
MPFVANRVFGWEPVAITAASGLRDLLPGHAYSVCNTLGCTACGLVFLDMRFDDDEMAALYADYRGPEYCRKRERFEPGYSARNAILNEGSTYIPSIEAILEAHVPERPRVLDWGGDTGLNTPFRQRAAVLDIYDISGKPPVSGVRLVSPEQARDESYDLVVCIQVLEHVPDPRAIVAEMASVMRRGTLLYIEVPHEPLMREPGELQERVMRKCHWHEHVNFFSTVSFSAVLASSGLTLIETISHQVSAGGRSGHILSVLARLKA